MMSQTGFIVFLLSVLFFNTRNECFSQENRNSVELAARHEVFYQGLPDRSFFSLQYGRLIKEHELFFRINSMWRPDNYGLQFETDFYPKFPPRMYGYFNLGYSASALFPRLRTAAEAFRSFNGGWEFSLGLRTLHMSNYNILSLTGTAGKYIGNWYGYLRPTVSFLTDGTALGMLLEIRRYFGTGASYLGVMFFRGRDAGITRDFNAIENSFGLETYMLRVKAKIALNHLTDLTVGADYSGIFIPSRGRFIGLAGIDAIIRRRF
jgi:YaiO family outer membrane protein